MINFTKLQETWKWRLAKAGKRQIDLASHLSVSRAYASYIVNGKKMTLKNVEAVEDYLSSVGEPFKLEYVIDE